MASIFPFEAVRPTRDKVCLVTCRPYEEYVTGELAAQLDFNPLSFLHVLQPAFVNQQTIAYEKRYRQVHQKYQEFKDEIILVKDNQPAIYIHKIITKTETFTGIIAATTVEEYRKDVIKKHEDTIAFRVRLLKEYMKYSGFNTEPVLLTYQNDKTIENWIFNCTQKLADFEFSTTKKETHYLWKIDDALEINWLQNIFRKMPSLYIADGHHRCEAAALLCEENGQENDPVRGHILSYLIAENNVRIYEYNRLIKDLNGMSADEFKMALQNQFELKSVDQDHAKPVAPHQFGMYLEGQFYLLSCRNKPKPKSSLDTLDTKILYDEVLSKWLNIHDLRNDERIEYLSGKHNIQNLKNKVDEGTFAVAFLLYPCHINEIKALADHHEIMPPKSTYIEPKFRNGLVIYEL